MIAINTSNDVNLSYLSIQSNNLSFLLYIIKQIITICKHTIHGKYRFTQSNH